MDSQIYTFLLEKPYLCSGMSHFLVKYRKWLFALMAVLVVACALMVPSININTDMTQYMPDSYPMKQGLNVMQEDLPALEGRLQEFGTLFANGDDLMPKDLPRILGIGVAMLFLVLLVMCSSVMEVLLFLVTTGFSVVLNMGTNALLPSVSMMTNMLSPVLQMVLSMDYCIILMNGYRQEKALGKNKESAMEGAVRGGASSILSSAFTTIVSLMMLCFIKLKIGADLGIVLSKGVAFSLLCNFTVLPFLILAGDRAVEATRKKVPKLPFGPIARFQHRFRYPLLVLFVAVFVGFSFLKRQTVLSFAPQWDNAALDQREGTDNAQLLLYSNADEDAVTPLMDSLATVPGVTRTLSYPSLVLRPRTASEMQALFSEFAPEEATALPEDMLSLVYYARFHPQRNERLSFQEMMDLVEDLSAQGLIPEGFDPQALMPVPEPSLEADPESPSPDTETAPPVSECVNKDSTDTKTPLPVPEEVKMDSTDTETTPPVSEPAPELSPEPEADGLPTYEELIQPRTAKEMAVLMGQDSGQMNMLYRLAGRRGKTMSLAEVLSYVREKILPNRRYSAFISKEYKARLEELGPQADSILAAGPRLIAQADTVASIPAEVIPVKADTVVPAPVVAQPEAIADPEPVIEEEVPPTPMEILAEMALSSMRYSSARIYSALKAAGVSVSKDQLDLLFLYSGAQKEADPSWKMSAGELLDFVADTLLANPTLQAFVPDSSRTLITEAREELLLGLNQLKGRNYSGGVVMYDLPVEGDSTSAMILQARRLADTALPGPHYWVGESEMYQELQEGFPSELLLLTLLTVLAIFVIVAFNFRSLFIPIPLVLTILSGVYVNIWASGLGGNTMYYLSYLIIQGILMGATIDYTILLTHFYLEARKEADIPLALSEAYKGSYHSVLTSGLILIIVPYVMSLIMKDPMIASILWSLSIGALAVVSLILFVLPGVLAALDPLMKKRSHERQKTA